MPRGRYASIQAEADRLGINPRTIRRRIADGTITGYRVAGSKTLRVDPNEVDAKLVIAIPTVGGAA